MTTQAVPLAGEQHDSPGGSHRPTEPVAACHAWTPGMRAQLLGGGHPQACSGPVLSGTSKQLPPDSVTGNVIDCQSRELRENLKITHPGAFQTAAEHTSVHAVRVQILDSLGLGWDLGILISNRHQVVFLPQLVQGPHLGKRGSFYPCLPCILGEESRVWG